MRERDRLAAMTDEARTLEAISRASPQELEGHWRVVTWGDPTYMRPPFDGEKAAILKRRKELGI